LLTAWDQSNKKLSADERSARGVNEFNKKREDPTAQNAIARVSLARDRKHDWGGIIRQTHKGRRSERKKGL